MGIAFFREMVEYCCGPREALWFTEFRRRERAYEAHMADLVISAPTTPQSYDRMLFRDSWPVD